MAQVSEYFAKLGIPFAGVRAHFVAGLELAGGILLAAGLVSRFSSLLLAVNMLTAYWAADREALLSFFSDPDQFVAASPFPFLWASLIVLVFGAGELSIDSSLFRRRTQTGSGDSRNPLVLA